MSTYQQRIRFAQRIRGLQSAANAYPQRRVRRQEASDIRKPPALPTLQAVADCDFLIATYETMQRESGQASGPDGVSYNMLSRREVTHIMREAARIIQDGSFMPSRARRIGISKSSGGTRTLAIRSILTRVIAKALHVKCQRYWESIFLNHSYGFRPHRGTWEMLLALEQGMLRSGRSVLATDDVRQAFDYVPIEVVMECHRRHTNDAGLLQLIETTLRGLENRERIRGIDQGSAYSPTALNLLLHHRLDLPSTDDAYPSWFRYADNLVYLCQDVSEGCDALERANTLLNPLGMHLKGEAGPADLHQQGTRVEILGYAISLENGQVHYNLTEGAWRDLELALNRAQERSDLTQQATNVLRGWISDKAITALERSEEERLLNRVLNMAASQGLREIPVEPLRRQIQSARDRWNTLRGNTVDPGRRSMSGTD